MQNETVWLCLVKTPASLQSNSLHLASGSFGIAVDIFRMPLKRNLNLGLVRYYLRSVVTSLLSVCELSRYVNGLQECFFHPQCRPVQHQNTNRQSWETNTRQTAVPTPKKKPNYHSLCSTENLRTCLRKWPSCEDLIKESAAKKI